MDKERSNQILEILLLPYIENNHEMLDYIRAYDELLDEKNVGIARWTEREKLLGQYSRCKKELVEYMVNYTTQLPKNLDDIYLLQELFFPKDKILSIPVSSLEAKLNAVYLYNLKRIADSLLTFRDGNIAIRTWKNEKNKLYGEDIFGMNKAFDKVEIWNNLSRIVTADTFVAAYIVMCELDETALYYQSSMISLSDKLLSKILQEGIAETHLHLNAGYDFQSAWEENMDVYRWRKTLEEEKVLSKEELENKVFNAAVIRLSMICFLESHYPEKNDFTMYVKTCLPECIRMIFKETVLQKCSLKTKKQQRELEQALYVDILGKYFRENAGCSAKDFLFQGFYKRFEELHTGSELIFLYQCFRYMEEQEDGFFCEIFLQYIRIKNCCYKRGVERNEVQGLERFQRYFSKTKESVTMINKNKEVLMRAALNYHLNMQYLKKLEVRIAPSYIKKNRKEYSLEYQKVKIDLKIALMRDVKTVLNLYRTLMLERMVSIDIADKIIKIEKKTDQYLSVKEIKERYSVNYQEYQFPSIGIVFHFLKREYVDDVAGFFCWRGIKDDLVKYSEHRIVQRQRLNNLAMAIEGLREEIPYLNQYIVGIDAASNENASEPWIMAPAFQSIRNRKGTKPVLHIDDYLKPYQKIINIGFTYHVGEDFRHPLSGLRHIDEVIEQFHYKPGDRLGHAIVLGMNIGRWIRENEVVALKAREQMENFLWLWGKMMYDGWDAPVQIKVLEGKILNIAADLYDIKDTQNISNIHVAMLYQAYCLKFRNNHEIILEKYLEETKRVSKNCDMQKTGTFCKYSKDACSLHEYSYWNAEKLLCTQYCPVFERRGEKVVLVSVDDNEEDILLYVQNKLISKIEKLGVYIETNPTSNLAIGEVKQIGEHPIFKLNALDHNQNAHRVMVTINSDDPSVFHTNVENEIAFIYHALEHDGYKKEDILDWVDKVRNFGVESSFVQNIKDTETMMEEIAEILTVIDRKLKKSEG